MSGEEEKALAEKVSDIEDTMGNLVNAFNGLSARIAAAIGDMPAAMREATKDSIEADNKRYEIGTRRRIAFLCIQKKIEAGHACGRKEMLEAFKTADIYLEAEKGE